MPKKILLIITGSVAAYKAVELARLLQKNNFIVTCVLTKAAQEFITPLQLSSVMQNKVYTELFDEDAMSHINLSRDNDLILVAPASADFIAKMANGYADDLASAVALAANKKIFVAPAMNEKMWENYATTQNIEKLLNAGVSMIEPLADILACGEEGVGKMQEPAFIAEKIMQFFVNQNKLRGKKILITGGGTREYIDPVRYIGNDSSGLQAIAIVKTLSEMGADVELIAANIFMKIPTQIFLEKNKITHVRNAEEMFLAVKNKIAQNHVFIGCAAVSDYRVKNYSQTKIKKDKTQNLVLELEKTVDILEFVGHSSNRPALVIGFAAESENLENYAKQKLQQKNCDFIVANDIKNGAIFGSNKTSAQLVFKDRVDDLGEITKLELAQIIGEEIAKI